MPTLRSKTKTIFGFTIEYSLYEKKMGDLYKKLLPYSRVVFGRLAEWALENVKAETPDTKTGTDIRGMWQIDHSKTAKRERFIIQNIYPKQEIILFFEEGTKPHTIRAKNAPYLIFFWETQNRWVKVKSVKHPGTPAYRMLAKTDEKLMPKIDMYIKGTIEHAKRIMAQGQQGGKR